MLSWVWISVPNPRGFQLAMWALCASSWTSLPSLIPADLIGAAPGPTLSRVRTRAPRPKLPFLPYFPILVEASNSPPKCSVLSGTCHVFLPQWMETLSQCLVNVNHPLSSQEAMAVGQVRADNTLNWGGGGGDRDGWI